MIVECSLISFRRHDLRLYRYEITLRYVGCRPRVLLELSNRHRLVEELSKRYKAVIESPPRLTSTKATLSRGAKQRPGEKGLPSRAGASGGGPPT